MVNQPGEYNQQTQLRSETTEGARFLVDMMSAAMLSMEEKIQRLEAEMQRLKKENEELRARGGIPCDSS